MSILLNTLNVIFDGLLFAGSHAARYGVVALLSLISAVIFMVLFKLVSNQEGIKREKQRILGHLFQMRLYRDDLWLIVASIFNVFKHNVLYLRYMLLPLVVLLPPLMIMTLQVNQRCGYAPFHYGDQFIVSARLTNNRLLDTITCQTTPGIALMTPAVRIYETGEAFWRAKIVSRNQQPERIVFQAHDHPLGARPVSVNAPLKRFMPEKTRAGSFEALMNYAEGFLPAESPLERFTIAYPREKYGLLGLRLDSVVLYFVLTLVFALLIKPFWDVSL